MEGTYNRINPIRKGLPCMVFLDLKGDTDDKYRGSRYIFGVIADVFHNAISIQITKSTWVDYNPHTVHIFPRHQVWAFTDSRVSVQLTLFEQPITKTKAKHNEQSIRY